MSARHDLWKTADALQMDLRAAQAKLVELRAQLAVLELPEPRLRLACPDCGIVFRGPNALAAHSYTVHDGPVPTAWKDAEALAG